MMAAAARARERGEFIGGAPTRPAIPLALLHCVAAGGETERASRDDKKGPSWNEAGRRPGKKGGKRTRRPRSLATQFPRKCRLSLLLPTFFTSPPPSPFSHIGGETEKKGPSAETEASLPNVSWPRFPSKFFLPAFPSFFACPPFPFFALLWAATLPFAAGRIFPPPPPPPPACQAKKAETGSVKPEPGN